MKKLLLASLLSLAWFHGLSVLAGEAPVFTRTEDVIYGRKFGTALTLDVFEPARKNGAAIFFIDSFGYFSEHENIEFFSFFYQRLLDHGYTIFAVVHGAQPRFIVPEIEEDIHRAVRFVRHNATRWGVDSNKFGIIGGSAGGHLSLTIGTQGGPGSPDAKDPIDRESSAVQAVACVFPPTDFLNWSKPNEDWMEPANMHEFAPAFGPKANTREGRQGLGREISPIYFVTSKMPPTLIIHGDADKLVPLYQSQSFARKCQEVGTYCKLIVTPGAGHGPEFPNLAEEMAIFTVWFDEYLLGIKPKE